MMSSKRVLVTGAGGFIGSHLAERLVREGYQVRAMVHYNALGTRGWLDHSRLAGEMEIVAGDVTAADCMRQVVKGCEKVYHLAALIGIPYSYFSPDAYIRTNIIGTANLLQACLQADVERVVHTSTSETYGTAQTPAISEQHPLIAQSPYAATKTGADQLAMSFHRAFGLSVGIIRPFNTFGPRQSPRAVIPTIIDQCLHGSEIRLGNLEPIRDFNYVDNTLDGFVLMGTADRESGEVVNIGSGSGISIGNLADEIMEVVGRKLPITTESRRLRPDQSEVMRLCADIEKASNLLGYVPKIGLREGLSRTVDWFRANGPQHAGQYRT